MRHRKTCMFINFLQTRVSRSVKTVHIIIYLQEITSCINVQLPIVISKKLIISDMRYCKTYMYINFSQLRLIDQSKICTLIYLQKIASCINLQLQMVILKTSILLDIHHHETYICINFQQN